MKDGLKCMKRILQTTLHTRRTNTYKYRAITTETWKGKTLAQRIQHDLAQQLKPALCHYVNNKLLRPGLAVIIVGNRRDSMRYVEKKTDAAKELGFHIEVHQLCITSTQTSLIQLITSMNNNSEIDGILVQLPLPDHLNADDIIASIDCNKDVDGLHPTNMGKLAINYHNQTIDSFDWIQTHKAMSNMISRSINSSQQHSNPHLSPSRDMSSMLHIPCAARACIELLLDHSIDIQGKHCVVLGRSPIIGLPMTLMLLQGHATVTNIDQFMPRDQMKALCQTADVIVTAVGHAGLITRECLKPGVVILDVGINFVPIDKEHRAAATHNVCHDTDHLVNPKDVHDGVMLVGDVDFESCVDVATAISPVPGGIGPLTVAMLMENTAYAFVQRFCKAVL